MRPEKVSTAGEGNQNPVCRGKVVTRLRTGSGFTESGDSKRTLRLEDV